MWIEKVLDFEPRSNLSSIVAILKQYRMKSYAYIFGRARWRAFRVGPRIGGALTRYFHCERAWALLLRSFIWFWWWWIGFSDHGTGHYRWFGWRWFWGVIDLPDFAIEYDSIRLNGQQPAETHWSHRTVTDLLTAARISILWPGCRLNSICLNFFCPMYCPSRLRPTS